MEGRRHFRIKEFIDVNWSMPGEDIAGQGRIMNLSSSGILLQIDNSFKPLEHCVLTIDPELNEDKPPFLSKKGKVVWFRKIKTPHYSYQCGVEFLKDQAFDRELNNWIENKTELLTRAMNASILNNYAV